MCVVPLTFGASQRRCRRTNNVHNLGKTGNMKRSMNIFRYIHDGETVLAESLEMNEAYPQKDGGNVNHPVKIEDHSGIFTVIFELSNLV